MPWTSLADRLPHALPTTDQPASPGLGGLRPEAAVTHLYRLHARSLRRLARSLVPESEVDDLVSDTFTAVLRALRNGRGPTDDRRGYLVITMRRQAGRVRRRQARLRTVDLDEGQVVAAPRPVGAPDPAVIEVLRSLPPRQQAILWATAVEGYTCRELTTAFDLDGPATASLAYRARRSFRRAYLDAAADGLVDLPRSRPA